MGAMINIEYDDDILTEADARGLAENAREIVMAATKIKDVFVYANTARIKVAVAPVEIFVHINAAKLNDPDALTNQLADRFTVWKKSSGFMPPINLTVIPASWHFKLGL